MQMKWLPAPVCLTTLEFHPTVDQNVLSTQNVQATRHVLEKNVLTPAPDHADPMLYVMFKTINQFAHVQLDSVEIPSETAEELLFLQQSGLQKLLTHVSLLHAEPMLGADPVPGLVPVPVCRDTLETRT
jgi:hypothetical protein